MHSQLRERGASGRLLRRSARRPCQFFAVSCLRETGVGVRSPCINRNDRRAFVNPNQGPPSFYTKTRRGPCHFHRNSARGSDGGRQPFRAPKGGRGRGRRRPGPLQERQRAYRLSATHRATHRARRTVSYLSAAVVGGLKRETGCLAAQAGPRRAIHG